MQSVASSAKGCHFRPKSVGHPASVPVRSLMAVYFPAENAGLRKTAPCRGAERFSDNETPQPLTEIHFTHVVLLLDIIDAEALVFVQRDDSVGFKRVYQTFIDTAKKMLYTTDAFHVFQPVFTCCNFAACFQNLK